MMLDKRMLDSEMYTRRAMISKLVSQGILVSLILYGCTTIVAFYTKVKQRKYLGMFPSKELTLFHLCNLV